jgi:hydroxymethylpyrimidine pyrophosphatase-like HAD family hydrolase
MDFYLDEKNCIDRLVKEWTDYREIVLAVDFDDTLFDFHKKGRTYENIIELIKRCQSIGCYTVIFTANDDIKHHEFIKGYLTDKGIYVDTINENVPSVPFKTRKVYYNVLLDDRAGLKASYDILLKTVEIMENQK